MVLLFCHSHGRKMVSFGMTFWYCNLGQIQGTTNRYESKVYFIISYFFIFKHSNSSLSILKVSNMIIYNSFLISKWLEWLLMALLPFNVSVVRNNTFYYSVQTQKPATFRIWKIVTMNSQMPSIVFAVLSAQWKLICTKSPSKPTNWIRKHLWWTRYQHFTGIPLCLATYHPQLNQLRKFWVSIMIIP